MIQVKWQFGATRQRGRLMLMLTLGRGHLLAEQSLTRRPAPGPPGEPDAATSPQQKQDLAAMIHLCGAGPASAYVRRGFHLMAGERCGDHLVAGYLAKVNAMKLQLLRLAAERPRLAGADCVARIRRAPVRCLRRGLPQCTGLIWIPRGRRGAGLVTKRTDGSHQPLIYVNVPHHLALSICSAAHQPAPVTFQLARAMWRITMHRSKRLSIKSVTLTGIAAGVLLGFAGVTLGPAPARAVVYCQYVDYPPSCVARAGVVLRPRPVARAAVRTHTVHSRNLNGGVNRVGVRR